MISRMRIHRAALVLGFVLLWCVYGVAPALAALPFQVEPELSLVGVCGIKSPPDPIEDPGCPGGSHPPSGRFDEAQSIAIDAYGNEYVASFGADGSEGRIDVFSPKGFFITELLDPRGPHSITVDSKGNLYVFEQQGKSSNEIVRYAPSLYEPLAGKIEYKNPRQVVEVSPKGSNGLSIDFSNDHLYVAQFEKIAEFSSAAEGNKLINTITHPKLITSTWSAVDSQRRRVFASYCKKSIFECGVLVFEADSPYNLLAEIDGKEVPGEKFVSAKGWLSIAVDEENGHFFIDDLEASQRVYEFDENFKYFSTIENEFFQGGNALQIAFSNSPLNKAARNFEYLFVPVLFSSDRVLALEPPEEREPKVDDLEAINIGETEAEIKATIDPEGGDTEYVVEVEGPGIEGSEIVAQGAIPGTSLPKQVGGLVSGLEPGATYSVRAFAENDVGDDEENFVFATYDDASPSGSLCPNEALRIGASAGLPDCRAYELVTPADTNGRPTKGAGADGDRFGATQASPPGSSVSFELIGGAIPGTEATGGFFGDPYRATRNATGWSTVLIGPSVVETSEPHPGSISPDQGYSFWIAAGEGTAVAGGTEARYVRYPDGHSELIGRGSLGTDPTARGRLITENGTHIVFQTSGLGSFQAIQLEPNAPPTGTRAVYDRTADEVTHVVSLLPGDVTPTKESLYRGASADGAGIAFENEGTLYLRLNNATTFQIGAKGAKFAGVSNGGKRTFYVEGGDLKAFDTEEEKVIDFTDVGDAVPVNVAPQGNRAYFVSEEAIAGSGQNPNGDEPQLGEQNLYRSDEGTISFVATVTERDVEGTLHGSGIRFDGLGTWTEALANRQPATDPSRLTPDGGVFLFQSRANLDGYDSGDFAQIYRYDIDASSLVCLSCPPTKVPATGGAALQYLLDPAAPLGPFSFVPNLRSDGARAFFESTEALVSSDTDEVRDVYEWEEDGVGSCTREGGCIYLISTGHSARNNYLFGHSASGDDVFFTTGDVLVGGDEDTTSVYDARVNGGFAEEETTTCLEEVCKPGLTTPPSLVSPAEPAVGKDDNLNPTKTCPKGKHKAKRNGKEVCVKNKKKKHHKHRKASKNGRTGK